MSENKTVLGSGALYLNTSLTQSLMNRYWKNSCASFRCCGGFSNVHALAKTLLLEPLRRDLQTHRDMPVQLTWLQTL